MRIINSETLCEFGSRIEYCNVYGDLGGAVVYLNETDETQSIECYTRGRNGLVDVTVIFDDYVTGEDIDMQLSKMNLAQLFDFDSAETLQYNTYMECREKKDLGYLSNTYDYLTRKAPDVLYGSFFIPKEAFKEYATSYKFLINEFSSWLLDEDLALNTTITKCVEYCSEYALCKDTNPDDYVELIVKLRGVDSCVYCSDAHFEDYLFNNECILNNVKADITDIYQYNIQVCSDTHTVYCIEAVMSY